MTGWTRKRFWTQAAAAPVPGGWTVTLDGRAVKTPGKAPLVVPTPALADLIATEWAAQGAQVDPASMPATRAANTAIDRVTAHRAAVVAEIAAYAQTDLLCYRAEGPADLVARQAAVWDPLLDWSAAHHGVTWLRTAGVMPRPQPPATLDRMAQAVAAFDPFALTALHDLVALPGSLVIGLAAAAGAFDPAALWAAARLDEDWQADLWGRDPEAEAAAALRKAAFFAAKRVMDACSGGNGPADSGLTC